MQESTPVSIADLATPEQYREGRQHLFPSDGSWQWYMRQHRQALIDVGAVLLISGRWHVHRARFDAYVLAAGTAAAARRNRVSA